jgi:hypothetical protein
MKGRMSSGSGNVAGDPFTLSLESRRRDADHLLKKETNSRDFCEHDGDTDANSWG